MDTALLHAGLGDPGPLSGRGERGRSVLGSSKAQMPNPQRQMGPSRKSTDSGSHSAGSWGVSREGCQGEGDGLGVSPDPAFHLLT